MNKYILDGIFVQTAAPWIWHSFEEHLEDLAALYPDSVLSIVKSLQELWVNGLVVIFLEVGLNVHKSMLHEDDTCETHIVIPVVFH